MPISRTGTCPIFLKYITEQALIPFFSEPTPEFLRLTRYNFRWIDIPSYQRGIVWDEELFESLLESQSIYLGNAILGSFRTEPDRSIYGNLPSSVNDFEILIDGLQRFCIGTSLLTLLHPTVLSDNPNNPNDAVYFTALKAQCSNMAPIYQHNDRELQNHKRIAVKDSYNEFRRVLSNWLSREFGAGRGKAVAENVERLFLQRQIAPDTYHGFESIYDVTNTFIGLNTIREQLSTVDWLRSVIVDRGAPRWDSEVIEFIENRFTEVFMRANGTGPERELLPFAAIILECVSTGKTLYPTKVFPSWNGVLGSDEVINFLDFVEKLYNEKRKPYYREIRLCGAIPFAGCIGYYYRQYLQTGQYPSFLSDGQNEDDELRTYLRANYRVLFDNHIGRTRDYSKRLLVEEINLVEISEGLSQFFIGCGISQNVDELWLQAHLKDAEKGRAPRIFNACLLPERDKIDPVGPFDPHTYGTKTTQYQIDHMIPESALQKNAPGDSEGRSLTNFAPVRRSANNRQSNLQCSQKLCTGGSYDSECINDDNIHPYISWLVGNQSSYGSYLDRQDLLLTNSNPALGDERINWITVRLLSRL